MNTKIISLQKLSNEIFNKSKFGFSHKGFFSNRSVEFKNLAIRSTLNDCSSTISNNFISDYKAEKIKKIVNKKSLIKSNKNKTNFISLRKGLNFLPKINDQIKSNIKKLYEDNKEKTIINNKYFKETLNKTSKFLGLKSPDYNMNLKNLNKTINKNNSTISNKIREGYLGRKSTNNIPYTYEQEMIYYNQYSTKSEKRRHELLLNEFNKIKEYVLRNPQKEIQIIKELLLKYNVENISKFTNFQLIELSKLICVEDRSGLGSILKPYLNLKEMLIDLLKNAEKLNKKFPILKKKEEVNNSTSSFNKKGKSLFKGPNIDTLNYLKQNNIKYKTSNSNEDVNTQNSQRTQTRNSKKTYSSPYSKVLMPNNISTSIIRINDNKRYENYKEDKNILIKKNISSSHFEIDQTQSLLKDMNYQTKISIPTKNYSKNYQLVINDMKNEIKNIATNYRTGLDAKKNKIIKSKSCIFLDKNKNSNNQKENKTTIKAINNRLFYSHKKRKMDYNQIKSLNKLTEYFSFIFASNQLKYKTFDYVIKL